MKGFSGSTRAAGLLVVGAVALAGCGAPAGGDAAAPAPPAGGTAAFPVTVTHRLGETVIPAEPQRIVTLGLTDQDAVLALGVVPVASTPWLEDTLVYPWAEDAVAAAGGGSPVAIDGAAADGGIEQVAALEPDLIIAIFSFMTADEYALYSQIAPTIAGSPDYPNDGTPWQEQTRMIGTALGREDRAEDVVAETDARFAEVAARNPAFANATAVPGATLADGQAALFPTGEGGGDYEGGAYAAGYILPALGFVVPDEYAQFADAVTTPLISQERFDLLDQDLIFWNVTRDSEAFQTLQTIPTYTRLPAVQQGRDVFVDETVTMGVYFSSVLSLPYVLEAIEPQLVAALDGDPATSTDVG